MRLVTAFIDDRPELLVESREGLVSVARLASQLGMEALAGVTDVGTLLEAGPEALSALRTSATRLPFPGILAVSLDGLRLAPPVLRPSKIIAVGLNYVDHATEGRVPLPAQPLLFPKLVSALVGHMAPIEYPAITNELDYEGELAVIIGREAYRVSRDSAADYVAGYSIFNDVSARDLQTREPQWLRGKSLDTFAPMGPYFVTADAVADVRKLMIETKVNGVVRQREACGSMVFDIPKIIEFITEAITLDPGDIIATGTPAGTGNGFTPPRYLQVGDVVDVTITGLGTLTSPVIAAQ